MKGTLIFIAVLVLLPVSVWAAQLTLAWDPNKVTPTGYALFERNLTAGESYDYSKPIWPTDGADHTEIMATVEVSDDADHAFVVRAYRKYTDSDNTEKVNWSADSNEVVHLGLVEVPKNLIIQAIDQIIQGLNSIKNAIGME